MALWCWNWQKKNITLTIISLHFSYVLHTYMLHISPILCHLLYLLERTLINSTYNLEGAATIKRKTHTLNFEGRTSDAKTNMKPIFYLFLSWPHLPSEGVVHTVPHTHRYIPHAVLFFYTSKCIDIFSLTLFCFKFAKRTC